MIKYFKKAFKITNDNIILATPLILFLFIFSIYINAAQGAPENIPSFILLATTTLFMLAAFFAGWFHMVKRAVELDGKEFILDEDKAKASFGLLKEIPVGIGEYFFTFLIALILYSALFGLISVFAFQIGIHIIGNIGIHLSQIQAAMSSPAMLKALIASLTPVQVAKLNAWNLLFLCTMTVFSFITLFWAAQIVSHTKNPFIAFIKSLSFTFKNFLEALILFVYISFINFTVSLVNAFAMANPITYFLSMLIYFYFIVYVVVLIFFYHDQQNRPKAQDYSNSGTDSNGQEQAGNSDSTEE